VILDLYSRQIVGCAMSDRLKSGFVVRALYQAIGRRHPASGCILHSDRGILLFIIFETDFLKNREQTIGRILDQLGVEHIPLNIDVWSNPARISRSSLVTHLTVIASRSHLSPETGAFMGDLKTIHGELDFISAGSSLKFSLIAGGVATVCPRVAPTMEWDTAAGQAIMENTGGRVLKADTSQPVAYNKKDLLNPWFIAEEPSMRPQS